MRVSLIKNGKIYDTILPQKVGGSFWIEDNDRSNQKRNLINIEAKDQKWLLKSNFETKIIINNNIVEEIFIEEFSFCELQVKNETFNLLLYFAPVYDNSYTEYDVDLNCEIYIGSGMDNVINYNNKYIADKQCLLNAVNGVWHIKNLTNNGVLFVNGISIIESDLNIGDVIFLMGLKIIICGNYLVINNFKELVTFNVMILRSRISTDRAVINTNVNEDEGIKVYEKEDYFFRMPRFRTIIEEVVVSIDSPPDQEKEEEMPLAYTLGPMITMGITSMVTGVVSLNNVMSGTQSVSSALSSLITCGAMLLSMIFWPMLQKRFSTRQRKKREKLRIKKYNQYIDEKRAYIRNVISVQRQTLIENNVPLDECVQIITNKKRNLWERKIEHNDFLNLRLGIGNSDPYVKVNYPEDHFSLAENNLKEVLDGLKSETKIMLNVPIMVNLTLKYISAIIGKENVTKAFIDGLLLQIMTFHSYGDLKIIIMTSKQNEYKWKIFKSSPYCWDDDRSIRFFSTNIDEANQISIYLENYFSNRKYEDGDTSKIKNIDYKSCNPYFLVITDDYQSLRNVEILKDILGQKINLGFSILFVQERLLGLPNECTTFINIDANESGIFENDLTKDKQSTFKADFIGNYNIKEINKLVANIPIEMAKDKYALPDKLGFLEMYNVGKIEQLNSLNRWKNNNPIMSLQAPVGIDTNGELSKLDLHEKFHGPHGLIAGMTGSGKSEFIITYILSMAVNYNPDEVSFVLIDYKGGGLAGAFENKDTGIKIPHLSGTITNLDVNDMKRSLASIQSELKRRQKIFNEAREKLNESTIDIYKYQKLRREGKVEVAVPHLLIISDEFAELKSQQPEFMEQLISTARIGRSLGVHLVLATQKPSGVVDDQIWSNTKFRVCLKVQDKSDSVDMIKCPDAASLHNVGRFYLQVGYNEFFALGQSAYAGVPYQNADKIKKKIDTSISFVNNIGYVIKSANVEEKNSNNNSNGEELSNIVKYLYDLGKDHNVFARPLWLNKIPDIIYVDELQKKYNYTLESKVINPVIGEYDDPSTQSQHLLTLPVSREGNVIIYGATGSGKDDLMSTIVYSSVVNHSVEEVNFYIIDCGAGTLKLYSDLPHVGDVLLSNDVEKVNNLFKMLTEEIEHRKKIFLNFGGTFDSYCKNSESSLPTIIVMINLYEAFEEMHPDLENDFNRLSREGVKYGVIFIISTNGVNFIKYKLKQNFKQSLVLQLNDENDYSDVVGNTHGLYPSKIKGRGLIKYKDVYEFQVASFKSNNNVSGFIKELGNQLSVKYTGKAKKIPILPKIVNFEEVKNEILGLESIPIGIEKNSLKISCLDLRNKPVTIISSYESAAFENFVPEFIKVCSYNKNLSVTLIDAEMMFENEKLSCVYYKEDFNNIFNKIYTYLERLTQIYTTNNYNLSSLSACQDLLVVIVGFNQFKNKLSIDLQEKIEKMMIMTKDLRKVSFVLVDLIDNIKIFEYENWYKTVVSNTNGLWIGDSISDQYTLKLSKTPKYIKEDIGNKFGYNVKKGNPVFVKVLTDLTESAEDGDLIDE